jgi:Tol biopolymer transport system component
MTNSNSKYSGRSKSESQPSGSLMIQLIFALFSICSILLLSGCSDNPGDNAKASDKEAIIEPDYSGITVPPNMAPLNFIIREKGKAFFADFSSQNSKSFGVSSKTGKIVIPYKKWKELLSANKGGEFTINLYSKGADGQWTKYKSITNSIAKEETDPYLYYRLLYPGYESWSELSINCRTLGNFSEKALIENRVADENCVNCHSFNNGKTDDFLFHMRGSYGGTYFYSKGNFKKISLKTPAMKNNAVYPRWHPSGKYVAFSSNKTIQQFHSSDNKKVEVSDLESSLVLYDVEKNEMMNIQLAGKENFMDTYPEWSPDGTWLYFCRAQQVGENFDYRQIRYNLYRVRFNPADRSFGESEIIFDASASGKSVAFPRIAPNGKYLVITVFDYGCFPIWHKEADLYSINLENLKTTRLELNSDFTDSYHSWSTNGKWLVFSSKRLDGLTARPWFSYINEDGTSEKPFVLPQKDPGFYNSFLKSFNIPEFSTEKIKLNPGVIRKLSKTAAEQASQYPK